MKYMKCDMHLHTNATWDYEPYTFFKVYFKPIGSPEQVYDAAKKAGMDFVTFTDHDSIAGCLELIKKRGRPDDFFISEEVSVELAQKKFRFELNVFDIDAEQHKQIQKIKKDFDRLVDYLRKENILYSYNHPFWNPHGYRKIDAGKIFDLAQHFRIVETKNSSLLKHYNAMAETLASELKLGTVGGSDSHTCMPGIAYTAANCSNLSGFLKKVSQKKSIVLGKSMNRAFAELQANLIIENTIRQRFFGIFKLPVLHNTIYCLSKKKFDDYIKKQQIVPPRQWLKKWVRTAHKVSARSRQYLKRQICFR